MMAGAVKNIPKSLEPFFRDSDILDAFDTEGELKKDSPSAVSVLTGSIVLQALSCIP